ncbi:HEAT repeat-containing protein [Xenococcus sp. PCC 7305]|uniref:HEAT repeat domain-containing protein n=1 Tax=Xenococcus sp. PCC 7305 TaxID=102125 RepID=UPI0002AD0004|nr:HEAT repeat domain-containing protein [Xenococcus sp. PCC 7305]ELS04488.1 HEAT repeat-containing protein [Xenococcus sp. PCC 7305]
MTYSKAKSETTIIIEKAELAARKKDWGQVADYLQQEPDLSGRQKLRTSLDAENCSQSLDLALQVLFYGDFQEKWAIAKIIPHLGEIVVEPLVAILENQLIDIEVRWFAVKILGNFKTQIVVIALANLLQNTEEEELIEIASETLSHLGAIAINVFVTLLAEAKYRKLAARALAYIRLPQALPALLSLAEDSDPEIRVIVIEAIGCFHDRRVPFILIKALKDPVAAVRKEAAIALGFRPDLCMELDLVSHLKPLLYDLNPQVCHQATITLGRMKHSAAITALNEVLSSPHTPIALKLDLVRALGWSEIDLALEYLQQALLTEIDLVIQEIIRILGRISVAKLQEQATKILVDFWHSITENNRNPDLKQALAISLGELGKTQAEDVLQQLAKDDNSRVRLHAIAGLKKMKLRQS